MRALQAAQQLLSFLMVRPRSVFKQNDLTRVFKAARAAGCKDVRVSIDRQGTIEIATNTSPDKNESGAPASDTDLDHELAEWEKRR